MKRIMVTSCAWCGSKTQAHMRTCPAFVQKPILQRYEHVAASTGTWMEKSKDGDWVDADEAFAEIDRLKARIDELEG